MTDIPDRTHADMEQERERRLNARAIYVNPADVQTKGVMVNGKRYASVMEAVWQSGFKTSSIRQAIAGIQTHARLNGKKVRIKAEYVMKGDA